MFGTPPGCRHALIFKDDNIKYAIIQIQSFYTFLDAGFDGSLVQLGILGAQEIVRINLRQAARLRSHGMSFRRREEEFGLIRLHLPVIAVNITVEAEVTAVATEHLACGKATQQSTSGSQIVTGGMNVDKYEQAHGVDGNLVMAVVKVDVNRKNILLQVIVLHHVRRNVESTLLEGQRFDGGTPKVLLGILIVGIVEFVVGFAVLDRNRLDEAVDFHPASANVDR